jgi:hypothetical protein
VVTADDRVFSPLCEEGDHARCGHNFAAAWFPFRGSQAVLCNCDCHSSCPLAGRSEVPEDVWVARCVCAGSDGWRESKRRATAYADVQRERQREVMESIDFGRGKSGAEIERLIVAGYAARGWEPPTDFAWLSRFVAAVTARRGRGARLAVEAGRSFRTAKKWLRESRDQPDDEQDN